MRRLDFVSATRRTSRKLYRRSTRPSTGLTGFVPTPGLPLRSAPQTDAQNGSHAITHTTSQNMMAINDMNENIFTLTLLAALHYDRQVVTDANPRNEYCRIKGAAVAGRKSEGADAERVSFALLRQRSLLPKGRGETSVDRRGCTLFIRPRCVGRRFAFPTYENSQYASHVAPVVEAA